MNIFADRIKFLRKEKDVMQKDVAIVLGISSSAYGFYEQGKRKPTHDILSKLSDYFNVSIDYLLGRTDERNTNQKITNATTIAAHRLGDVEALPDEAIDEINNYIDLMRLKYLKK